MNKMVIITDISDWKMIEEALNILQQKELQELRKFEDNTQYVQIYIEEIGREQYDNRISNMKKKIKQISKILGEDEE